MPAVLVVLVLAAVAALVLGLRGAGPPAPGTSAVAQDAPGPVLLVTGYGGGAAPLEQLAGALRAAGRQAVVVPVVDGGTGDLTAQAEQLTGAVTAALAAGAPSVDVVGYSAGGVVARVWRDGEGAQAPVRRVVTLGSPHHGTRLAALAAGLAPEQCPAACRQLAPGSDLLTALPEVPGRTLADGGAAWTSVWTATDEVVTPPVTSRLEGAVGVELQAVCPGARTGHGALPVDPLVVGLVQEALDEQPLAAPPPAEACDDLRSAGQQLLAG
ncbi:Triacylglycerol esterase/lipase EstA, alpha/beta hydrolase fold [Quadrisphaera sp. DSM 44207]|nr:Triacylglycerol esterase/lipase EstA, alpha/beta hydrolase fold [Quadrisphaera sp. DSM 44207]